MYYVFVFWLLTVAPGLCVGLIILVIGLLIMIRLSRSDRGTGL